MGGFGASPGVQAPALPSSLPSCLKQTSGAHAKSLDKEQSVGSFTRSGKKASKFIPQVLDDAHEKRDKTAGTLTSAPSGPPDNHQARVIIPKASLLQHVSRFVQAR